MAIARSWNRSSQLDGPYRARVEEVAALNRIFSDAFTDRYRRDGMVGVRVPQLNPVIWRYAIEDAGEGALLWRDERGDIAAFNMVHQSGIEGWMGPLAVRTDRQATGAGKEVVREGIELLKRRGATVIGLETMPRTMDNIGFYSGLGFIPGHLTITLTLDGAFADKPAVLISRLDDRARDEAIAECRALVGTLAPGYDYTREIELTDRLSVGETVLLREGARLVGFALCHTAPLVEGRIREELRVLKLVLEDIAWLDPMATALCDLTRRSGTRRVAFRVQSEYTEAYQRLVARGGRVRWTDLRMSVDGARERRPERGMLLSNWEI